MPYNHYPGDPNQYPKGTPSEFPFPKQDFQEYAENEVITKSSAKNPTDPLMATSGTLTCKSFNGAKTGYTTTHNFRMLCNPIDNASQKLVRYTDIRTTFFGCVNKWQSGAPSWAGLHIFSRYQTEDDLYVASWRVDGKCTIKKKVNGKYTTLKQATFGAPALGDEHLMAFEVNGNLLSYFVDGNLVLEVTDNDLEWGTSGVRTDYSDSYVDYFKINDV